MRDAQEDFEIEISKMVDVRIKSAFVKRSLPDWSIRVDAWHQARF